MMKTTVLQMMKTTHTVMILVMTAYLLIPTATAQMNKTQASKNNGRDGKILGIFSVVKFPNDYCTGSTTYNGTCYTAEECNAKSGTASGSCASGFGVCCTFSVGCGTTISENSTYHTVTSFSTSTDSTPCEYTICKSSSDVCKLRIDFSAFSIYTPFTSLVVDASTVAYVPQGIVANLLDEFILGDCLVDQMVITSPGHPSTPTMCGIGPGQHMYVDASDLCNKITFNIDTDVSYTRSWSFSVHQVKCNYDYGKHECLQYFTGTSGKITSWNLDTTLTAMAPAATNHHLNDQYYHICFRQERGYCRICYSPVITTAASSSFGVSASAAAAALQSGAGDAICTGITVYADYIEVDNLVAPTVTSSLTTTGFTKRCGALFNAATANAASGSACSYQVPFRWGVHFNDKEELIAACTANYNTCENQAAGGGGIGFHMHWWQETC